MLSYIKRVIMITVSYSTIWLSPLIHFLEQMFRSNVAATIVVKKRTVSNSYTALHSVKMDANRFITRDRNWDATTTFFFASQLSKVIINMCTNKCDLEPFSRKIDHYIKSLDEIVTSDQASRRESAQRLLDSYKEGSKILFYLVSEAKKWRDWWPAWTPAIQAEPQNWCWRTDCINNIEDETIY